VKVEEFLNSLKPSLLDKIDKLSKELNSKRDYKNYKDFEDIVHDSMISQIKYFIKPTIEEIPAFMRKD